MSGVGSGSSGPVRRARRLHRSVGSLLLVGVLGTAACSGATGAVTAAPGAAAGAISGVQGTLPAHPLRAQLLEVAEVRRFVVLGFDSRQQPVLDTRQFDLAQIHGPCGAPVATPFRATEPSSYRVFRSTNTQMVEALAEPGPGAAEAFVDQLAADARAGCPVVTEQLGTAAPSTVALGSTIELPEVGDRRVAWSEAVTAADGSVSYRYVAAVAGQARVLLLVILSPRPLAVDALVPVVVTAAAPA